MAKKKAIPVLGLSEINGKYIEPIAGIPDISGAYNEPRDDSFHPGVDYKIASGTPLFASADGVIIRADGSDVGGYGNQLRIWHKHLNITSIYGHMSGFAVNVGDVVTIGQFVGSSGGRRGAVGAGSSKGAHLHFEVQVGRSVRGRTSTLNPHQVIEKWKDNE